MLIFAAFIIGGTPQQQIELRIEQLGTNVVGEPQIAATVINHSDRSITLVEPGDGSEGGWRTPTLRWIVTPVGGEVLPEQAQLRCGNMNAPDPTEIFTLAAKQEHVIDELGSA